MTTKRQKDFNAMMNEEKGMPKIQIVTDEKTIKKNMAEQKCFLHLQSTIMKS